MRMVTLTKITNIKHKLFIYKALRALEKMNDKVWSWFLIEPINSDKGVCCKTEGKITLKNVCYTSKK